VTHDEAREIAKRYDELLHFLAAFFPGGQVPNGPHLLDAYIAANEQAEREQGKLEAEAVGKVSARLTNENADLRAKLQAAEQALQSAVDAHAAMTAAGAEWRDRAEKAEGEVERLKSRCRCCDRPAKMDGLCTSSRCRQFAGYGRTFDDEPEPGAVEQARAEGVREGRGERTSWMRLCVLPWLAGRFRQPEARASKGAEAMSTDNPYPTDEKCYELARHFLADSQDFAGDRNAQIRDLAETIQKTVESWFALRDGAFV